MLIELWALCETYWNSLWTCIYGTVDWNILWTYSCELCLNMQILKLHGIVSFWVFSAQICTFPHARDSLSHFWHLYQHQKLPIYLGNNMSSEVRLKKFWIWIVKNSKILKKWYTCRAMKDNMEWQVMFEVSHLFRELPETYQFSGLLAECLVWGESVYYITVTYEY